MQIACLGIVGLLGCEEGPYPERPAQIVVDVGIEFIVQDSGHVDVGGDGAGEDKNADDTFDRFTVLNYNLDGLLEEQTFFNEGVGEATRQLRLEYDGEYLYKRCEDSTMDGTCNIGWYFQDDIFTGNKIVTYDVHDDGNVEKSYEYYFNELGMWYLTEIYEGFFRELKTKVLREIDDAGNVLRIDTDIGADGRVEFSTTFDYSCWEEN